MKLDENQRTELIKYRLSEATETIQDVQLLLENDRLRAAVNRIYYGMYYALTALALKNRFETSKHGQLIGWFNKEYINKEVRL